MVTPRHVSFPSLCLAHRRPLPRIPAAQIHHVHGEMSPENGIIPTTRACICRTCRVVPRPKGGGHRPQVQRSRIFQSGPGRCGRCDSAGPLRGRRAAVAAAAALATAVSTLVLCYTWPYSGGGGYRSLDRLPVVARLIAPFAAITGASVVWVCMFYRSPVAGDTNCPTTGCGRSFKSPVCACGFPTQTCT